MTSTAPAAHPPVASQNPSSLPPPAFAPMPRSAIPPLAARARARPAPGGVRAHDGIGNLHGGRRVTRMPEHGGHERGEPLPREDDRAIVAVAGHIHAEALLGPVVLINAGMGK